MTQQTDAADSRFDTVFQLIGIVLVALAAVLGGAVVWYTVDVAALSEAVSPAAVATVVFTMLVVVAAERSGQFADYLTMKNQSGQ